jgi:hypothetical protein
MTDGTDDDRVLRIIKARCGDVLSDADFALITQHAAPPAEPDLPVEIGEQILDVLAEMGNRLDRLAGATSANGKDDDATERR